jgi:acetoin utilization deacetylase AcuC-like enzyme
MTAALGAYLFSPAFLGHDPPPPAVQWDGETVHLGSENPSNSALTAEIHGLLERTGILERVATLPPAEPSMAVLTAVHDPSYVERVAQASRGGSWEADFADVAPGTYDAALLCAGAACLAARDVLGGRVRWAFVNSRPPGHHALADRAMGSCFFNNGACAAEQAIALGAERVLIVDWDVHIGNGAEAIFWNRADVLALSIHQRGWYPRGAGATESIGGPGAEHRTVNVELPPATSDDGYLAVLREIVHPIAVGFRPDLIVLSAGQDPSIFDPMGRMCVSAGGFRRMASALLVTADQVCDGRLVCLLEGGYSHMYTPLCVLAVVEGLLGLSEQLVDPFDGDAELDAAAAPAGQPVFDAISRTREVHPCWF